MSGDRLLLVGLGNPGPRYEATRHNIGQIVLDELARRRGERFREHKGGARVVETWLRPGAAKLVLATPNSFMNVSGGPVSQLARFYDVPAERIVEDVAGFDTYDSCVRARDVYGATGLTIVTQDYHVPRALTICRSVGLDAVGVGDTSFRERHPSVWARGAGREWLANLKMEWDLLSQREPQQDPASDALLRAVEAD